ncbi:RnaseH-domain-containing protein [Agrocybe pediades]|nr:RnaseH-domain-containing protein [Agrocybe pediades]
MAVVTQGQGTTTESCDSLAILKVLKSTEGNVPLLVGVNNPQVLKKLTTNFSKMEDRGWIGVPNSQTYRKITAALRARKGMTTFQTIQNEEVRRATEDLAKHAMSDPNHTNPPDPPHNNTTIDPEKFVFKGAKLSEMTQALIYKGIIEERKTSIRRETLTHLDMTRYAVGEFFGKTPSDEQIWNSLRSKDLGLRARNFLWKSMHNAYKVGAWWDRIPNHEIRGWCHECDTVETLEHILTECRASGQEIIWKLVEETWSKKSKKWKRPTLGLILGCGLANFHPERGKKRLTGANRLWAILISESAHLIWTGRCTWKIEHEGRPDKIPSEQEIRTRWLQAINTRLKIDCLLTDRKRYGRKALSIQIVEKTWWGILSDQRNLPENWIDVYGTGVLVGIGGRPPGRNR